MCHFYQGGNKAAVILVKITPLQTEIHIQVIDRHVGIVPWGTMEDCIPYLQTSDGTRYDFIGALNPTRRYFYKNEVMVLLFQPLPLATSKFSLIEGNGGEEQLRTSIINTNMLTYWNYIDISLS